MTRQGLYKLIRKMEDLRLIETGARGFQRVTGRWIDTDSECKQSLHQSVNKVDSECKQSLHQSVNKVDAHNKDKVDNKIDEIEREVDEKKSASLTPAPALPDQLETELESYINHVEAKKEKAPQVAPPPPLIVTTHSQPQDGIKITTVEAMNLPSPDAPKFYQPTNPQAAELLMAGLGRKPMAETADEAAALIEAWCKENAETVKSWYSRSKRAFSPDDLTALTIKFCSCYSNHAETGKQTRFMGNPVLFFRNGFSSWLIEQKKYDVAPIAGGATRYEISKKGPNNFGSDPDKYLEKQAF